MINCLIFNIPYKKKINFPQGKLIWKFWWESIALRKASAAAWLTWSSLPPLDTYINTYTIHILDYRLIFHLMIGKSNLIINISRLYFSWWDDTQGHCYPSDTVEWLYQVFLYWCWHKTWWSAVLSMSHDVTLWRYAVTREWQIESVALHSNYYRRLARLQQEGDQWQSVSPQSATLHYADM